MHFNQKREWSLFAAFFLLLGPAAALAKEEGRVVTVVGQVSLNGVPAKAGDVVPTGGTIETKNGATASLIFGSENVVKVSSNSSLSVESSSKISSAVLNLTKGNVDGVKKSGTKDTSAVVVRTQSAIFELSGGRYSVAHEEGRDSSFVAVDGNASVTYVAGTENGQKPGDKIKLPAGSILEIKPVSKNSTTGGVSSQLKTVTESEAQSRRPSVKSEPTVEQYTQQLVATITDRTNSADATPRRMVASTENAGTPSLSEIHQSRGLDQISTLPALPRDPMQTIPGRGNANVTVVFQP